MSVVHHSHFITYHSRSSRAARYRNRGFTLIELLVVIAIISLLVSILLPSLQRAKLLAQSAVCLSNQRNLGMGFQMHAAEHEQRLPKLLLSRDPADWITDDSVPGGYFTTTNWVVGEGHWPTWMDALWEYTGSLDAYRCAAQGRADDKPGYGYNGWISGEYGSSPYEGAPDEPISMDDITSPSELIFTGDSVPVNDQGLILVRPDAIWGPTASWPGHSDGGNFCFADGHAETVSVPDDVDTSLIYNDWGSWNADYLISISPNYNHDPPDL